MNTQATQEPRNLEEHRAKAIKHRKRQELNTYNVVSSCFERNERQTKRDNITLSNLIALDKQEYTVKQLEEHRAWALLLNPKP